MWGLAEARNNFFFKTAPLSLRSAETPEDGHRDEGSAGYRHASAATGKLRLSAVLNRKRLILFSCLIYDAFAGM